jgi:hypothetical protein
MAKKKNNEFEIDQLRKDKMIYALESIALAFVSEIIYLFVSIILGRPLIILAMLLLVINVGYFLYMAVGNLLRLKKIKELSK